MKIKEVDRTANIAWSPAAQHPIYLAAGTSAQQFDATFSTTAALELFGLNLTESGFDMDVKGSVVSDYRFHNIAWGCHGMTSNSYASGIIVGGADGGNIVAYDPVKILNGENSIVFRSQKHSGAVRSLDYNCFQPNLLASGGSDSEIFIWDLNQPTDPMTPGPKSQPLDDVTCVAWNCQVEHILASTFAGRCVVFDLRKNEQIIKVSDNTSRMRCKVIAWHPDVATQLCIASEDDQSPVIQMWDLRFATSPLKVFENHNKGILSLAWCKQDSDLLVSCGKDNRILCWNPNTNVSGGEVVCELNTSSQWSFNVAWCERNPALIANSSFDGHIGVYSLMGGQQQVQPNSKISDSFPGSDNFAQPPAGHIVQQKSAIPLKKPPKWLRKPVGATFSFGGKLVTFENKAEGSNQVTISQVTTNDKITGRSTALEQSLSSGSFVEYCQNKIDSAANESEKTIWLFLKAKFDENPKLQALKLLGYNPEVLSKKINEIINPDINSGVNAEELANRMSSLSASKSLNSQQSTPSFLGSQTPENSRDISRDAFDVIADAKSLTESPITVGFPLPIDDGVNGLITKAILVGNIEDAVNLCIQEDQMADALILAMAGGNDLFQKTKMRYLKSSDHEISKLISALASNNWMNFVINCDIMYWKEALSAIITYSGQEEFSELCEILGKRLENEKNGEFFNNAAICYICSGNLDNFIACLSNQSQDNDSDALQDLMEQVLILEKSVEICGFKSMNDVRSGALYSSKLSAYANILAVQGDLFSAFKYLNTATSEEAAVLKDRIYRNISSYLPGVQPPPFPFKQENLPVLNTQKPVLNPQRSAIPQNTQWSVNRPPSVGPYQTNPSFAGNKESFMTPPSSTYNQVTNFPSHSSFGGIAPTSVPNSGPINSYQPKIGMQMQTPPTNQSPAMNQPMQPPPTSSMNNQQTQKGHFSQRYPQDPSLYSQNTYNQNQNVFTPASQNQSYISPPNFNSSPTNLTTPFTGGLQSSGSQFNQNMYNPNIVQKDSQPPPVAALPTEGLLPAAMTEMKQGWNDPPVLKSAKPPKTAEMPAAITQPIFNPNQVHDPVPTQTYQQNNFNTVAPPNMNQYNFSNQSSARTTSVNDNQNSVEPPKQAPPVEKPCLPIPTEHQIMQQTFENLRAQCCNYSSNPQMKRKLDDVARKLENLYNKLRDSSLSENSLQSLHQMVQLVQQKNYQAAISIHTSLITSGNFSEISNFMPGLKVLFQIAMQLGV